MKRNTVRNIKLGGILTGLVTASIGITAFSLPQFNSMDSYLYTPTNWTQSFVNREEAKDYLKEYFDNEDYDHLFTEEISGTRTVNEYLISAALEGIKNDYFSTPAMADVSFSEMDNDDLQAHYDEIYNSFVTQVTEGLVNSIIANKSKVYAPLDDIISGSAFTSGDYAFEISEYFRGLNGQTFNSLSTAFNSLIDESQIVFNYNGGQYQTIADVVLAWMTDEGFTEDAAFKEVEHHVRWTAAGLYNPTVGNADSFTLHNDSNVSEANFKTIAENAFYNQMKALETYAYETYDRNDWYLTSDYTSSRDAWLNDPINSVGAPAPMNAALINGSMGDAFGFLDDNNEINDYASDFFLPGATNGNNWWWQRESESSSKNHLPNMHDQISDDKDIAVLTILGYLTTEAVITDVNHTGTVIKAAPLEFCSTDGISLKNSDAWLSWTRYAEFMGFNEIEIAVEDRLVPDNNTVNEWWEPDCEGSFKTRNLGSSSHDDYHSITRFEWFNETILGYFNYEFNLDELWYISKIFENQLYWDGIRPTSSKFVFGNNTADGNYNGMSMLEALMTDSTASPTEADYLAGIAPDRDFADWVSKLDVVILWNGGTYSGKTEEEAIASVDAAIEQRIEGFYSAINISETVDIKFDIADAYVSIIETLDPNFNMTDYNSIEEARIAVKSLAASAGNINIWEEVGIAKFFDDNYYNFDTSVEYASIEEARDEVNWELVAQTKFSDINQIVDFDSLVEYRTSTVMLLAGYNGSTVDVLFDLNETQFAKKLVEGWDLTHIDPSIQNINLNIDSFDENQPHDSYELTFYKTSLAVDSAFSLDTTWVETKGYIYDENDPTAHLEAINEARLALINSWIDQLTY